MTEAVNEDFNADDYEFLLDEEWHVAAAQRGEAFDSEGNVMTPQQVRELWRRGMADLN